MKAEELGVEIYPGFAASEVFCAQQKFDWPDVSAPCLQNFVYRQILYNKNHEVIGIATSDMGISKDGSRKDNFQRGVELKGMFI